MFNSTGIMPRYFFILVPLPSPAAGGCWLEACFGSVDAFRDDDIVDIIDDSYGVNTVGCLVSLSSSLDSPPADAMDCVCYAVDDCNHFSIEDYPVMESMQC